MYYNTNCLEINIVSFGYDPATEHMCALNIGILRHIYGIDSDLLMRSP
jgi:hypothetical protein